MATTARLTARDTSQLLARFAWFTLAFMVIVVLEGAVVRATSSGGGCGNRWPLCNGDFFPHHPRLATVIEYTHRSLTGICTTLVIALAGWTFYATRPGHKARRAVVASCFFLVTEALLGAVLVLRGYVENNISVGRVVMQSIHFTNTMLLLGALSLTVWFLAQWKSEPAVSQGDAKWLVWLTVTATTLIGAAGSLAALADTLFPSPSPAGRTRRGLCGQRSSAGANAVGASGGNGDRFCLRAYAGAEGTFEIEPHCFLAAGIADCPGSGGRTPACACLDAGAPSAGS